MQPFQRYVVLDFEATCDDNSPPVPQEVIELPSVLLDGDLAVLASFESFVRPVHNPTLSDFCRELTGITQADVDAADPFPEVLARHSAWLRSQGLQVEPDDGGIPFAIITCGDWDLARMFVTQSRAMVPPLAHIPLPWRRWINIKSIFANALQHKAGGMARMLQDLDLELRGRHHRGIDDCHNIARIATALAVRGATFEITSRLSPKAYPTVPLVLVRDGERAEVSLERRTLGSLLGIASHAFRQQARAVSTASGAELTSVQHLYDLRAGDELQVR